MILHELKQWLKRRIRHHRRTRFKAGACEPRNDSVVLEYWNREGEAQNILAKIERELRKSK